MMLTQLISFTLVSVNLIKGASVTVHPGENITLSCTIKDDQEISWIITNGNQTFVRILRLEHLNAGKHKPDPSFTHPDYEGRIIAVSSLTQNHSLTLINITSTDLMLYCCTDCKHEQTYCTKLDFEVTTSFQECGHQCPSFKAGTENISNDSSTIWLPVLCVLLSLSLVSNVCICWRKKLQKGSASNKVKNAEQEEDEADEIIYASVNIVKAQKNGREHHLTQDTVYASIK